MHRQMHSRSGTKTYQTKRKIINDARSKPCVDCGTQLPPECMHLDHVRGTKLFAVGAMGSHIFDKLFAEIAKCDVRCPNCHALRHYYQSR